MLQRISRKRTRVEIEAWQLMRDLMPRGRKTRGIQYEALEYLFERLYEVIPEEELGAHLRAVKGHLQATGDPVKGAINNAIKELQRLPGQPFEIVKIQEATARGAARYIRLNFKRFEEVIDFDLYYDYLQDVLHNERLIVVRGISRLSPDHPELVFPGLTDEDLADCRTQFLINAQMTSPGFKGVEVRYIPDSAANLQLLLVYEDREQLQPFLGFVARPGLGGPEQDHIFILYRGAEKISKLRFWDRIWQDLSQHALDETQMETLRLQARDLAGGLPDDAPLSEASILSALMSELSKAPKLPSSS
ncbi:hypothetical protein SCOR_31430 [Sulfidibacter corallicola]|uniref:Uncharacterized protein n=1 Tax=Sulfidibacter corallicola TaxID=2818388 RepID=A0A8A4TM25_SULCO|nr:hypothetical protein [Sulfidibacter corallicola]QTD49938.1 hypothetical protein J3U87_30520 [Sulfidibacter corallicola]